MLHRVKAACVLSFFDNYQRGTLDVEMAQSTKRSWVDNILSHVLNLLAIHLAPETEDCIKMSNEEEKTVISSICYSREEKNRWPQGIE